MPDATPAIADRPEVHTELARAFRELRPRLLEVADQNAALERDSRRDEFSDEDVEQFLNAYEMLLLEALEGTGREKRELIFDTALPPVIDLGRTALDMVRSSVSFAILLAHRLLPLVRAELRDDAALWLAGFYAEYTRELGERALALEAERR